MAPFLFGLLFALGFAKEIESLKLGRNNSVEVYINSNKEDVR